MAFAKVLCLNAEGGRKRGILLLAEQAFLVLQGGHSGFFLKYPAKIGLTAETTSVADLTNGQIGIFQHILGGNNASHQDVVHNSEAR